MRYLFLIGLIGLLFTACSDDDKDYTAIDEQLISDYILKNNIDAIKDPSGLYYTIEKQGSGEPINNSPSEDDVITFSYKATTINGETYTDSKGVNGTYPFSILPYGFQIGLSKINRLGEITLYTPSALTRDPYGNVLGPKNTVMIYKIKVDRDQKDIDEDIIAAYFQTNNITAERDESGLYIETIEEGSGANVPANAAVNIKYTGKLMKDGKKFDESDNASFYLSNLIEAWQIGIPKLKKGSKAIFYCPSQLSYGSQSNNTIPANSILIFEIEILDFN